MVIIKASVSPAARFAQLVPVLPLHRGSSIDLIHELLFLQQHSNP